MRQNLSTKCVPSCVQHSIFEHALASTGISKTLVGQKKLHMATPTSKPFSAIIFRISSPPKKSEKQLTFSVMILVAILASIGTLSGLVLNGK
jgi:hypothetical protein